MSSDADYGGGDPISPPIWLPPPQRSQLGLLPGPSRAQVTRISGVHHEEVGEHMASPASGLDSTGLGPRDRCQKAPPRSGLSTPAQTRTF